MPSQAEVDAMVEDYLQEVAETFKSAFESDRELFSEGKEFDSQELARRISDSFRKEGVVILLVVALNSTDRGHARVGQFSVAPPRKLWRFNRRGLPVFRFLLKTRLAFFRRGSNGKITFIVGPYPHAPLRPYECLSYVDERYRTGDV